MDDIFGEDEFRFPKRVEPARGPRGSDHVPFAPAQTIVLHGDSILDHDIPNGTRIQVQNGSLEIKGNIGAGVTIKMEEHPKNEGGFLAGIFGKKTTAPNPRTLCVHGATGSYLHLDGKNLKSAIFHGDVGFYAIINTDGYIDIGHLAHRARVHGTKIAIQSVGMDAIIAYNGDRSYHGISQDKILDHIESMEPMIVVGKTSPNSIFCAPKMIIGDKVVFGQFDTEFKKSHAFQVVDGGARLKGSRSARLRVIDGGRGPNDPTYG